MGFQYDISFRKQTPDLFPPGSVGRGEIESGHPVWVEEGAIGTVLEEETDEGGVVSV